MADARTRRLAERIAVIVAELLERRIKDPRLGFVTVTKPSLGSLIRRSSSSATILAIRSARRRVRTSSMVGHSLGC